MSKPTPRRASNLAGAHPVDDQREESETASSATATPATRIAAAASPIKFSVSIEPGIVDELRDAFWEVRHASRGRYRTLGDVVAEALRKEIDDLGGEFNNGQPFARRPTENLPAGRPTK